MLPKYSRILLKLSGESLMGDRHYGIDPKMLEQYANEIKAITNIGVQVAVVIGGGNIYRGMNEHETGIERAQGRPGVGAAWLGSRPTARQPHRFGEGR